MNSPKPSRCIGAVIFVLALALRLAWVGCVEHRGGELFGPDALSYDHLATHLLAGEGLWKWDYQGLFADPNEGVAVRAFRPPGLPLLLAGIYGLFGHHFWVARVAMALLSAATCVVAWRIGRRLFGAPSGVVAGLMMACYPKLIYYSATLVTETPYIFLLTLAVATLLAANKEIADCGLRIADLNPQSEIRNPKSEIASLWRWPAAGALLGLAVLCRSVLLGFPLVAGLWVLIVRPRRRRAVGEVALLGLGFLLVMAPWWVRNGLVLGHFVPATTEGGLTFWVTNREGADGGGHVDYTPLRGQFEGLGEVAIDRKFYRLGREAVRGGLPASPVRLAGAKFVRFWRLWPHASEPSVGLWPAVVAGATFIPVLLLAAWGAVVARAQRGPLLLFLLLIGYYTLLHVVFMAITRYRLPLEPFLIVLAGCGGVDLWQRLNKRRSP